MLLSSVFSDIRKIAVTLARTDLPAGLAVELLLVGCLVEVEVASKELVGAFAGDDHLHPERLDLARHEEHGRARPDRRHVVRLGVVDHVFNCINAVLMQKINIFIQSALAPMEKK